MLPGIDKEAKRVFYPLQLPLPVTLGKAQPPVCPVFTWCRSAVTNQLLTSSPLPGIFILPDDGMFRLILWKPFFFHTSCLLPILKPFLSKYPSAFEHPPHPYLDMSSLTSTALIFPMTWLHLRMQSMS